MSIPISPSDRAQWLAPWLAALCATAALAGCNAGAPCQTNREFFADKVWSQVIAKTCIKCHAPEGVAADRNAKLLLLTASYPGFLDTNLAAMTEIAKVQYDGVSELLLKPTGKQGHGGGTVVTEGSEEYRILQEMVARASNPVTCPGTIASPSSSAVVLLPPADALRKAALSLASRLPTDDERERVRMGGEAALAQAVDGLMREEAFVARVKEIWNDLLLTNRYMNNGLDLLNDADYPGKYWYNPNKLPDNMLTQDQRNQRFWSGLGVASEPLELIAWVVRGDKPFSEILTADYTMVNAYSARTYGLDPAQLGFTNYDSQYNFRPGKVQIQRNGMMLPLPHAGILTMPVYLSRYPTTDTNLNRHRARMTFKLFLATDLLAVAERPIDPSSVTSLNPTRDDPYCKVCHKIIDPVAGTYQKFDAGGRFNPEAMWPAALPQPGFGQNAIDNVKQYPQALQWLGQQLTSDQRFITNAVQVMYKGLTGHDPLPYPREEDPDHAARLAAWQEQDTAFQAIAEQFRADKYNLKTIVRMLVLGPVFRAQVASGAPATLEGYGTGRLLPPEMLARKIAAVFNIHWWRGDKAEWLANDYNLLYGGIDNTNVVTRLTDPNGVMASVALRMSTEMSCGVTGFDFTKPRAARVLFPFVEPSFRPEDDNGYEVPAAVAAIRQNIQYLHQRILGETLPDGDPEIERTYKLLLETHREWKMAKSTDLPFDCQGRFDREQWVNLPQNRIIDRDNYNTIRAWMAVVTYLLADYRFLHE